MRPNPRSVSKIGTLLSLLLVGALYLAAQGLTTDASPRDWEEVNFEFNSHILSDGYPSLLRLAELLKQNPGYRLELTGHTDSVGSNQYNDALSLRRSNTVKEFLVKYGANPSQIVTTGQSKNAPKVPNTTKEGRFINRRVVMTLRDANGNVVAAGGVGDSISALQELMRKQEECCNEILKRLDKLDDILNALNGLKNENDKLRSELDQLKNTQNELANRLAGTGAGAPVAAAAAAAPAGAGASGGSQRSFEEDRANYPGYNTNKFTLMGINFGPRTPDGNITFNARARYFNAFNRNFAIQSEGEYFYWKDRQEGQFDVGLVGRGGPMQLGLFSSFKRVNFSEFMAGGTLGQASATVDYVFNRGRMGFFGTKAFLTDQVVNSVQVNNVLRRDTLVAAVDQAGFSGQVGLWGDAYLEGNLGVLFRRFGENKAGGMGRIVQPLNRLFALTFEGGVNETLVGSSNYGRFAVGLQLGNFVRPKDFASAEGPVPVDIPRIRYELVTREVRSGNTPPVADAGGDRFGAPAGQILLDGSASYDPDGDRITYQWEQVSGPTVAISGVTQSRATFTAELNQTYVFRLTVRDDKGAFAIARATISTQQLGSGAPGGGLRITRFEASPLNIAQGESVTLSWITEGADAVNITNVGSVEAAGSRSVTPTQTTTYVLTATRGTASVQSTVTVTVGSVAAPRILRFTASDPQILPGGQSTLIWEVENATEVTISGIGVVNRSGSSAVSPAQTTTYVLTARNANGQATAQAVVSVTAPVKILDFRASPTGAAEPGTPITLSWETQGAQQVVITGIGNVEPSGQMQVTPTVSVSYTLIAYGPVNNASAVVVVQVGGQKPGGGTGGANRPPVANAGPDRTVNQHFITLDGTGSFDPDGDPITYRWRSIGNKQANIINPETPTPTINAFNGGPGEYIFELTVTDSFGAFSVDTVRIILSGDAPPVPAPAP
jgi:hypothetical protein